MSTSNDTADRERWLQALAAKEHRDYVNEMHKEVVSSGLTRELRSGGKAAERNSRVATEAEIPNNRYARRILARYGTHDEILEFIETYGYDCDVAGFISRYRPGSRKSERAA